ncbi:hypothetical protein D5086_011667 [Populus alba]|uniref:Uncharacterized protein n=1 Tax=Populus alba TaxID=43335 RepID=A0ACC4CD01_POPAL
MLRRKMPLALYRMSKFLGRLLSGSQLPRPFLYELLSMAAITNFLSKPPLSLSNTPKLSPPCLHSSFLVPFVTKEVKPLAAKLGTGRTHFMTKATAAPGTKKPVNDEKVQKIHSVEEFDEALKTAKNKLVVVEYAASHSYHSSQIYPFMLHRREDVEKLIDDHKADNKLIVLDVGLKHCGPCVKVYPTVIKLSRQMSDTAVFARMNGDENDSCMQFLKDMDVVEVPTFLFIRDGKICGRYVGSGKGELIGEILRYQGVRVTY